VSNPPPERRPGARAALVVAIVLLASAAVGFFAYHFSRPAGIYAARPGPVREGRGSELPAAASASTPAPPPRRAIPEQLPDISLPGPDGAVHRLQDWRGKPLLINFWATWCEPCRREIPLLKGLRQERRTSGLEVLGIALDTREAVLKYAALQRIDYPLLVGEQGGLEAVSAFGMDTVLPFSVFADRSGRIITLKVGELHRNEAELILDRIQDLDSGKLTLAAAREQISGAMQQMAHERAAAQ
jgi:thiol-disulfide isomerase/thioredoxin